MLTRGTALHTREELGRELEDIAGGVSGFSGNNSAGVHARFLSRFFDRGLALFAEVLTSPVFPDAEIEKLREDTLAAIKRDEDYLPGYTFKLMYRELFPTHPYGMPVKGTLETVAGFKREDIKGHYENVFAPERMVLSVVGDVNTDYVIERVREAFKGFERKGGAVPELKDEAPPSEVKRTGDTKLKAQTNIGLGFIGPRLTDRDSYAMDVLNEVLSSHGGRLFVELRDRKSLAYAVSSFARAGVEAGTFAVYIGCAPDKAGEAIEGILRELGKVRTEKITDEELDRAKSAIIGGYEMSLQETSTQASDMGTNELLGLGYDHHRKYPERIKAVTADDVLRAARKYITLDGYVMSVVGPENAEEEAPDAETGRVPEKL